jgi:hypothetical protein
MTVNLEKRFSISDNKFDAAREVVEASGAESMLASWRTDAPGSRTFADGYTLLSLITLTLAITSAINRPPTIADLVRAHMTLTPRQYDAVGIGTELQDRLGAGSPDEYMRFYAGSRDVLDSIDSASDIRAVRMSNAEFDGRVAARTAAEVEASTLAAKRRRELTNAIVAGSVRDRSPEESRGDVVVDETIIDLAKRTHGLGVRPEALRGPSSLAQFYARDKHNAIVDSWEKSYRITGFGFGVTALTRVGPPDGLHRIPPLFVGIDMHTPTSGSVDALRRCLEAATGNGLLPNPRANRQRWPILTVDMGYNVKKGYGEVLHDYHLDSVARFPAHWNLVWKSGPNAKGESVGPLQVGGAFFCPAAEPFIDEKNHIPRMQSLLEAKRYAAHDSYLRRILPFAMGRNSRPYKARATIGRPRLGVDAEPVTKIDLVCPAALGNVACPLKPESMRASAPGVPLAEPRWNTERYVCCRQSSVTVTLTRDQERMAQWAYIAGCWDHALIFEGRRALTEQRFSRVKDRDGAGLAHLCSGPRREPFIALTVAAAFATINLETQDGFSPKRARKECIDVKRRRLQEDLGHEPAKPPPLT